MVEFDDRMAITFSPLNKAKDLHGLKERVGLNNTTARNVDPVTDNDSILDVTSSYAPVNWSLVDTARAWASERAVLLIAPPVTRTGFDALDSAKYVHPQSVTC